ncbi:hypothetical protein OUZ56_000340 [Daphnia magna]|uniref:Uncharacterized protein n=1 Tax=Daphnia magna TaxID=35525 RepID=A0ABR0A062_9CRUS|nr:hypothetical protein OUZ56_000340 [Daphnia magna]
MTVSSSDSVDWIRPDSSFRAAAAEYSDYVRRPKAAVSPCQSMCNGPSPTNGFCSRIYVLAFSIRNVRFLTEFNLIILVERRRVRGLERGSGWEVGVSGSRLLHPLFRLVELVIEMAMEWEPNSFHRNAVVLDNEFSPTSIRLVDS